MNRLVFLAALTLISFPAMAGDYQPGKYNNANDVMYTQPWNRTGNTGVMMVPYTSNTSGDYAEQTLYLSSGEMAPINRVYAPADGADMISKLGKLQQMQNKSVDLLVISGHASEGTPIVMFGNGRGLQPTDVSAIRDLTEFERAHPGVNNRAHQALLEKAKALVNCRNLMAPNATIVVLNCHALESPAGRKFMEDIGDALMGTKGGRLIASSDLIETMQLGPETGKLDWLMKSLKTGRWLKAGDTAYGAHWESIMIAPDAFPKMPASLLAATGEDKLKPATGAIAQFQGNWQKPDSNITITASGVGMSATEKGSNTSSNHWGSNITFSKIDGNVAHGKAQGKYSDQDKDITTISTVTFTLRDRDHLDTHWVIDDAKAVWHPGVSPYTSAVHTGAIFDNQYTRK